MSKLKILNLYAGIGGNRKLWGDDHEVTAVENVQAIADIYAQLFPNDTVIVGDAHQYLLDHHKEFDFIRSDIAKMTEEYGINLPKETKEKRKLLRNAVIPELGLHVFECRDLFKQEILL